MIYWAASRKKVSNVLSLCHNKRRMAAPALLLLWQQMWPIGFSTKWWVTFFFISTFFWHVHLLTSLVNKAMVVWMSVVKEQYSQIHWASTRKAAEVDTQVIYDDRLSGRNPDFLNIPHKPCGCMGKKHNFFQNKSIEAVWVKQVMYIVLEK